MAAKEIAFDTDARDALKTGIDALTDAIKVTLGPARPDGRHRSQMGSSHHYQQRSDRRPRNRAA